MEKIIKIFKESEGKIKPHFILTGPSGSGKTFFIQTIAEQYKIPVIEINAATLTKEGYSGCSLSKVMAPLGTYQNEPVICFIDEWDKLFISDNYNTNSVINSITIGVQNEFLKMLESEHINVFGDYGKYPTVNVSKVLFIFAGAFNGAKMDIEALRNIGVKTEFLGRVNLLFNTEFVTEEALLYALQQSSLFKLYCKFFNDNKESEHYKNLTETLKTEYKNVKSLGYRVIHKIVHEYFLSIYK